jgi:hypothetical protein
MLKFKHVCNKTLLTKCDHHKATVIAAPYFIVKTDTRINCRKCQIGTPSRQAVTVLQIITIVSPWSWSTASQISSIPQIVGARTLHKIVDTITKAAWQRRKYNYQAEYTCLLNLGYCFIAIPKGQLLH